MKQIRLMITVKQRPKASTATAYWFQLQNEEDINLIENEILKKTDPQQSETISNNNNDQITDGHIDPQQDCSSSSSSNSKQTKTKKLKISQKKPKRKIWTADRYKLSMCLLRNTGDVLVVRRRPVDRSCKRSQLSSITMGSIPEETFASRFGLSAIPKRKISSFGQKKDTSSIIVGSGYLSNLFLKQANQSGHNNIIMSTDRDNDCSFKMKQTIYLR